MAAAAWTGALVLPLAAALAAPRAGASVPAPLDDVRGMFREAGAPGRPAARERLRRAVLGAGGRAVPVLVEVMKGGEYPDQGRWAAVFLLGRVMGRRASPFISRFLSHPKWVLRMASLKTLLALGEARYAKGYARALRDPSLLVRGQALENIVRLGLAGEAPAVWAMLEDGRNYYDRGGRRGKTVLIGAAVRGAGALGFEGAVKPLAAMLQEDGNRDIAADIERSLGDITGKEAPGGGLAERRRYWARVASRP